MDAVAVARLVLQQQRRRSYLSGGMAVREKLRERCRKANRDVFPQHAILGPFVHAQAVAPVKFKQACLRGGKPLEGSG